MKLFKNRWLFLGGCGLLLAAGCLPIQPRVVYVPEAQYRTETNAAQRLVLPLTEQGRNLLTQYFEWGGNWRHAGSVVDLTAADHYRALLDLLQRAELSGAELSARSNEVLRAYFKSPPVTTIIDARELRRLRVPPAYGFRHGDYWWVFYSEGAALSNGRPGYNRLMVVKRPERERPGPW